MLRRGAGSSPPSGRASVQGNAPVSSGCEERGREASLPALSRSLPVSTTSRAPCASSQPYCTEWRLPYGADRGDPRHNPYPYYVQQHSSSLADEPQGGR